MTLRNRQTFEKDCMDLRKTEKNKRGKCCIGGLWGLLLAFSSVILTVCTFTTAVGMVFVYFISSLVNQGGHC